MPLSMIFYLEHPFRIINHPFGSQLQGWFNKRLSEFDPAICDEIHSGSNLRPYTFSTIIPLSHEKQEGKYRSFFRLTLLDESLGELCVNKILPKISSSISLRWMDFGLTGFDLDHRSNRWVNSSTYFELSHKYAFQNVEKVKLQFESPTTFRKKNVDIPLPDPSRVYLSYWKTWNAFAPRALRVEEDWLIFAKEAIILNRIYRLETERWKFNDGHQGAVTGFIGEVEFSLRPVEKLAPELQNYYLVGSSIFRTLSAFSFYSGTGWHCTIGLGQTFPKFIQSKK